MLSFGFFWTQFPYDRCTEYLPTFTINLSRSCKGKKQPSQSHSIQVWQIHPHLPFTSVYHTNQLNIVKNSIHGAGLLDNKSICFAEIQRSFDGKQDVSNPLRKTHVPIGSMGRTVNVGKYTLHGIYVFLAKDEQHSITLTVSLVQACSGCPSSKRIATWKYFIHKKTLQYQGSLDQ